MATDDELVHYLIIKPWSFFDYFANLIIPCEIWYTICLSIPYVNCLA
jgi:hypothetical protein